MKTYVQYRSNGSIWQAGKTIYGLCAAYNHTTNPAIYLTDREHKQSFAYARAIKNRMARLGYAYGTHYTEFTNGSIWPIKGATA